MPRPFKQVPRLRTIRTSSVAKIATSVGHIVCPIDPGLMTVIGNWSVGKTYAVQWVLESLLGDPKFVVGLGAPDGTRVRLTGGRAAGEEVTVVYFKARKSLRPNGLYKLLGRRIDGTRWTGTAEEMRLDLFDVLAERLVLLVIDEAQTLTDGLVVELRTLFDEDCTRLALLLVGDLELTELLARNGALVHRRSRAERLRPVPPDRAHAEMRRLHPLFENADPAVLDAVNERAHGRFRLWVLFLDDAVRLLDGRPGPLDLALVSDVWALHGEALAELERTEERERRLDS